MRTNVMLTAIVIGSMLLVGAGMVSALDENKTGNSGNVGQVSTPEIKSLQMFADQDTILQNLNEWDAAYNAWVTGGFGRTATEGGAYYKPGTYGQYTFDFRKGPASFPII